MRTMKAAFSTPILIHDWEEAAPLNQRLEEIILHKEASEPGMQRSNIGSWDSKKDLLQWPYPEIRTLKNWIITGVREITQGTTRGKVDPSPGDMLAHAWANVSRADSYRKIHNHESCTWSGVYYVKSKLVKERSTSSGNIEFLDPRMLCISTELPHSTFGGRVRVVPKPGRLVVFPNWLLHYVNPVEDASLRICIAFNVKLQTKVMKNRVGSMRPIMEGRQEISGIPVQALDNSIHVEAPRK